MSDGSKYYIYIYVAVKVHKLVGGRGVIYVFLTIEEVVVFFGLCIKGGQIFFFIYKFWKPLAPLLYIMNLPLFQISHLKVRKNAIFLFTNFTNLELNNFFFAIHECVRSGAHFESPKGAPVGPCANGAVSIGEKVWLKYVIALVAMHA